VKEDQRGRIPAVTHVDGTARVQTVTLEDNGTFYEVVREFGEITGIPVILNTSFNVNREPIVETPLDALICAFATSIHFLVMEGRLVDCARYRDPELVKRMRSDRDDILEEEYRRLTRLHLRHYDEEERNAYLREENIVADWHRLYSPKYELEKAMAEWRRDGRSVLIVGTRAHTKVLYLYIPEFPSVAVRAYVPCDDLPGEATGFSGVYAELALAEVPWDEVDVVLISSHEYQRELTRRVRDSAPAEVAVLEIYDDACDSLVYTLPEKWPILNAAEGEKHQLVVTRRAQRTASNIDFDFEPSRIDVGDRYAVAINYHFVRTKGLGTFQLRAHERPDRFEEQLARLSENFMFCRARDLVDPSLELPESNVVLTFDDGVSDVGRFVLPCLEKYGVKATVYVCSKPYLERRLLDVHKIEFLMTRLGVDRFRDAFYRELQTQFPRGVERESLDFAKGYQFYRYDVETIREFKIDLNYRLPYANVIPVLDVLFRGTFGEKSEVDAVGETYLSLDDLKRIAAAGHEIGVHTNRHRVLPRLDFDEQKREIEVGMQFLRDVTGETRFTVAYPNGFYDDRSKRALKELGVLAGVSMERRMIKPDDIQARWSLPRYDVNDCFDRESNAIRYEVFSNLSTGD